MKHNDLFNSESDQQLRQLLQKEMPPHRPAPWFTQKVMNRLPERRLAWLGATELSLYTLLLIATLVYAISYAISTFRSGILRVSDLITLTTSIGIICGLLYMIMSPFVSSKNAPNCSI